MGEATATAGNNALALEMQEYNLGREVSIVEDQANRFTVASEIGYQAAGEFLKQIKSVQKKVKDYWEPLRLSAKKAYDDVLAKKKEMLDPMDSAEKTLKSKMGTYIKEQERKAREAAEAQRKLAEKLAEEKLKEAAELEQKGEADAADYVLSTAEVYEQMAETLPVQMAPPKPKVQGVSVSKTWTIRVTDPDKVPVKINGVEVRPINEATVRRIVRECKGNITIPGIEVIEEVSTSVRV